MNGLRIHLFGGLTLEARGETLPPIASRTARSLFAYLVTHRHTNPTRDLLAGVFWPDMVEAQARRRLSHALWQIQSVLSETANLEGYIEASTTTIRFAGDAATWIDVEEFETTLASMKNDDAPDRTDTLDRLVAAVRLYTGDFLAGFYDDWIMGEQERLRQSLYAALNHIIRLSKSWGNFDQALVYARRLALLNPLHEEAHREVMRLCYLLGQPNEALAQYERCASILAGEIGAEPAAETLALREEIAIGRQTPLVPFPEASRSRLFDAGGTPLVGRSQERLEIIARMEDALAGSGGIVLLEGDPGTGKTRLLTEGAEDANWRGLSVLWGTSPPSGGGRPFEGMRRALEDGLTELRVHQLAERLDEVWLQALAPILPAIPLWAPDLRSGSSLRGGGEERDRVREAFRRTLTALARLTPTMLVLDDLHRMDEDTVWVLDALAADLAETPLLICVAYRRAELEARDPQWDTVKGLDSSGRPTRIVLQPLSPAEAGELVRRLMPQGASGSLVTRLHAATGGNPLFMLETLRALHEQQVAQVMKPPSGLHAIDIAHLPVSDTVYDLVTSRLSALPGETLHVARVLAVNETGLDIDSLADVCDLPRANILDAVDALIRAGMAAATSGFYQLAHDQLALVAYDSTPEPDRALLHRRLAQHLEASERSDPARVGHHFRLGGLPNEAATHLEQAARNARGVNAYAAARDRYTEALAQAVIAGWSIMDRARLQFGLESVLEVFADRTAQAQLLDGLTAIAGSDTDLRAEVLHRRARLLAATSQLDEASRLAKAALELHGRLGDKAGQAEDLQTLGRISLLGAHYLEAADWLSAALELTPAEGLLEANARQVLADAHTHLHEFEQARAQLVAAEAIYTRLDDRRGLAGTLGSLGVLYGQMGTNDLVEPTLLEAARLCNEIGYRYGVGINALNLGHHYTISGQAARALEPAARSRDVFQAMGDTRSQAMATANLASLHHALGNDGLARQFSHEALEVFEVIQHYSGAALCHGTLAEIARREENPGEAGAQLAAGLAKAAGPERTNARLQLRRTEAHLHLDAGDYEAGLEIARSAWDECTVAGADWLLPDLSVPLARALVLTGRAEEALAATSSSTGCAEEAALLYWRMRAHQLHRNKAGARAAIEAAHVALLRRIDGLSREDAARSLNDVPIHAEIESAWRAHQPDTVTVRLAATGAPTGRPIGPGDMIELRWTIHHPIDDHGLSGRELRAQQILRLTAEAATARAAPTIADLAGALDVSTATVRRDIDALRSSGYPVRTRGRRG